MSHPWIISGNLGRVAGPGEEKVPGTVVSSKAAQDSHETLKLILTGKPPSDIFVRWKPIDQQPIGGNPDPNDGVRLNIRPFVTAGILRKTPTRIKRTRDRGNEPRRPREQFPWCGNGDTFKGERVNDVHLTNAEKQAAHNARGGAMTASVLILDFLKAATVLHRWVAQTRTADLRRPEGPLETIPTMGRLRNATDQRSGHGGNPGLNTDGR